MNKLMLQMMDAFAEFERALIKERPREGIAQAQEKGVKIGRQPVLSDTQVKEIRLGLQVVKLKPPLQKSMGFRDRFYTLHWRVEN